MQGGCCGTSRFCLCCRDAPGCLALPFARGRMCCPALPPGFLLSLLMGSLVFPKYLTGTKGELDTSPSEATCHRETSSSIKLPAGRRLRKGRLHGAPACCSSLCAPGESEPQVLAVGCPAPENPWGCSWAAFPGVNDKERGTGTRCALESSWWLKVWATGWFSKHLANELPAASVEDQRC